MLGLGGFENNYPRDLSGGQRQRVGIARAIINEVQVLLLDEPFSALDIENTEKLYLELLDLWKVKNLTIIMVSHSIEEAVYLGDRVSLIKNGKVLKDFDVNLLRPREHTAELEKIKNEIQSNF